MGGSGGGLESCTVLIDEDHTVGEETSNATVTALPPHTTIAMLSIVTGAGLAGCLVIIYMFARKAKLRNPPNLLIINLALADTTMLLCYCPTLNNMVAHPMGLGYGPQGCLVHSLMSFQGGLTSILTIGLIALSRFIAIVYPQNKAKMLSWKVCGLACVYALVHAFVLISPAFAGWGRFVWHPSSWLCSFDFKYYPAFNLSVAVLSHGLTSVTMAICYTKIYAVYRKSKKRVAGGKEGGQRGVRKEEIRLAIQLLVVFVIYSICWGPYLIIHIFLCPGGDGPLWLFGLMQTLVACNSAVNVLVYLYFNQKFRTECLKSLGLSKIGNNMVTEIQ